MVTVLRNDDIIAQILKKPYPNDDHVLVYDNATTHWRRVKDALSSRNMPKNPANWGVPSTVIGPDGKLVYGPDGKVLKQTIQMADGFFDGKPQSLYFPDGHPNSGLFKGMKQILIERGITKEVICDTNPSKGEPAFKLGTRGGGGSAGRPKKKGAVY